MKDLDTQEMGDILYFSGDMSGEVDTNCIGILEAGIGIKKHFLTVRVVKHWNGMQGEVGNLHS